MALPGPPPPELRWLGDTAVSADQGSCFCMRPSLKVLWGVYVKSLCLAGLLHAAAAFAQLWDMVIVEKYAFAILCVLCQRAQSVFAAVAPLLACEVKVALLLPHLAVGVDVGVCILSELALQQACVLFRK